MNALRPVILLTTLALWPGVSFGQVAGEIPPASPALSASTSQLPAGLTLRDSQGLPGVRPRISMSLADFNPDSDSTLSLSDSGDDGSAFSWSLEAWRLNTASLAHIQCRDHALTDNAFLASDCRFVDQPTPDNAVNLVQVRGEWMAAPNLKVGMGAFVNPSDRDDYPPLYTAMDGGVTTADYLNANGSEINAANVVDGLDVNLSFGIQTQHVGDFLIGLQLARYRQRLTLGDLTTGLQRLSYDPNDSEYAHSAQLALGWQLGNFRTDVMGQHRQAPMLFSSGYSPAEFSSFDLEFSWRPRNGSLSIGVSNVLDSQPRADNLENSGRDEALEGVFGRIPYVRYKHDL